MKKTFCTIATKSHIPYVLALYESLKEYDKDILLNACIIDDEPKKDEFEGLKFYPLKVLSKNKIGKLIIKKYGKNQDKLRWGLKSVFIDFLITKKKYDKVIYVDTDIHFFNNYNFLFSLLDKYSILLTPHWREFFPSQGRGFKIFIKDGFFNAGFIGCNKEGVDAIRWWSSCCLYKIERDYCKGFYDDQKYLDLIPLIFKNVRILNHKGCNVAEWNKVVCKRTKVKKEVLINKKWPIIFIHFTESLIKRIEKGKEELILEYYKKYKNRLKKFTYKTN